MKKIVSLVFITLATILGITLTSNIQDVKADAVNYTVVQPSGATSYADAYFSKPATVNVVNNSYQVSYTVKTDKKLGSWPVRILSMNVQTTGIKNSEDANFYYTTITFTSNQLSNITGTMKVDIDSIDYHHTYPFGLMFSNYPKLNNSNNSQQSAAAQPENSNAESNANNSEKKSDKDKKPKKKTDKKKSPKSNNKSDKKKSTKKDENDKTNIPQISAAVAVGALALGGGFFAKKKKLF
ncbi:NEAT domain-containing protein [Companilactobacillus metriopterae]|uniref:NEAT domain-containing protein n=1 Tax=Companilactobacillus metriopterae TaxID=1909267 RepID=UPI00100BE50E|nr:NEAT domain-containing protein [Companilactobacillus metriopterae]